MSIPRPEYPRDLLKREDWLNLNGVWQFEMDLSDSGCDRDYLNKEYSLSINVPFCPESELSGIGNTDFMDAVWYRKVVTLPESWNGKRTVIHFGAVDYFTEVYVNGMLAGTHMGGYTSFEIDTTPYIVPGENTIVVHAQDHVRTHRQPAGKQSTIFASRGCCYTRTTGIWQTVWMECLPETAIRDIRYESDIDNACMFIETELDGETKGAELTIEAFWEGTPAGSVTVKAARLTRAALPVAPLHLWEVGKGGLYDARFTLKKDGKVIDRAESYFGMRKLELKKKGLYINDKPVFMRLILDQGFYPDGIYTAPTDDALRKDIELSMAMGFNGARLHEKVFEQRFLYWADKLGYIVWGEYPDWGEDRAKSEQHAIHQDEWLESVRRDRGHAAIVGWCPYNEVWGEPYRPMLKSVYLATKAVDNTRPVIDASGGYHELTDIYDVHNYCQDPEEYAKMFAARGDEPRWDAFPNKEKYGGQPYFVSEYGGIWAPSNGVWETGNDRSVSWGYGKNPKSAEEFVERYRGLTNVLLANPDICGFCYTQLTDVEQEQNGLYNYHRVPKCDPAVMYPITSAPAAFEQEG